MKKKEGLMESEFLHVGGSLPIRKADIVGVFDIDNTATKQDTRNYLAQCEKQKKLSMAGNDLPKAFLLTEKDGAEQVVLTSLSARAIAGRWKHGADKN